VLSERHGPAQVLVKCAERQARPTQNLSGSFVATTLSPSRTGTNLARERRIEAVADRTARELHTN